jgi:SAM-dependent methyltransferase
MRQVRITLPKHVAPRFPRARFLAELAIAPVSLAAAAALGLPGAGLHLRAAGAMLRAWRAGSADRYEALSAMAAPFDSVRYFELAFAWEGTRGPVRRHLDVSSPRLFPLLRLQRDRKTRATLLNPDEKDLAATRRLAVGFGVHDRCDFLGSTIGAADLPPSSFDLVTCLSVIEHIPTPADGEAVRRIRELVAPGGRVVITVPCAREPFEEIIDVDAYGTQPERGAGFFFGQRFYDQAGLEQTFFANLGLPRRSLVVGERRPGWFADDRAAKHAGAAPLGREAWRAARALRAYPDVASLPGAGIAAMEFVPTP